MEELGRVIFLFLRGAWIHWIHSHPDAFRSSTPWSNGEAVFFLVLPTVAIPILMGAVQSRRLSSGSDRQLVLPPQVGQVYLQPQMPPPIIGVLRLLKAVFDKGRIKSTIGRRLAVLSTSITLAVAAYSDWPYDAYLFLKFLVFLVCGMTALDLSSRLGFRHLAKLVAAIALLYNPFFPIHFHREVWSVINLVTAVPLAVLGLLMQSHPPVANTAGTETAT
ncbi:MAG: hypothetical protein QOK38_1594 [Acidobacteriaceae bacterium]|jgi:hypothetical protein|nr:hypothetical protein [Acidobacteriaceae bacterium]